MLHGRPAKCTGNIARVLSVIFRLISMGSIFNVVGSISARTGVAPACIIALTVAQKVIGVVITSSPLPIPLANMLRCSAAVQECKATALAEALYARKSRSNCATLGPDPNHPD